jgi:hypothetical protein
MQNKKIKKGRNTSRLQKPRQQNIVKEALPKAI